MMRFFTLLFFLLICTNSMAQKSKGDSYVQQASEQVEKGDAKKAVKLYLNAKSEYLKEGNFNMVLSCAQTVAIYYQDTGDGEAAKKLILETIGEIPEKTIEQLEVLAKLYDNLAYTYLYNLNQPKQALDSYTKSIALYEKAGLINDSGYAMELSNRATSYYEMSQFEAAVKDMTKAISIYEKLSDTAPDVIINGHQVVGQCYVEMAEFDKAVKSLQAGMQLAQQNNLPEMKARLMNGLGTVYLAQDQFQKALEYFSNARDISESLFGKDADNYATNLINIASVYSNMGDKEAALKQYQEVFAIYEKTPPEETSVIIDLLLNIKIIMDDLGKFEESETILQQAMMFARKYKGDNSLEEADVYLSMATTAENQERHDESLQYNFKALSIMDSNNYPKNQYYAQVYSNIAKAYDELNNLELALKYNQAALDLFTNMYGPEHASVATAISNIGLSYEKVGDYDKALEYLNQSLAVRLKVQKVDHDDVGTAYLNIGLIYLKKENTKLGVEYLEKARVIYDHYNKHINKAMVYNRLAWGYLTLKDKEKSARYLQQSIISNTYNFENRNFDTFPDKPDFLDFYEIITSYIGKTDWYVQQGDQQNLLKAVKQLDAADKILKEKAINLSNAKDRLELAELYGFFTEEGLLLAEKLYKSTNDPAYLEKAFYYSERSKANELMADIQVSNAAQLSRIPKKIQDRKKQITNRINALQLQIAAAYTTQNQPLITKLKAEEFDLTREYEGIQQEMIKTSPQLSAAMDNRTLPPWSEVKKLVDNKTLMVSYVITDSAKFILIGNNSRLVLKSIDNKINIEKLVRGFTNQVKFQGPALKQITQQLTDILWTPVESTLKDFGTITKVIIVPDGPLHYLPFEVLGNNGYLIEKYTIQYQLSGALMLNTDVKTSGNNKSFIALAPIFEDNATNFINKSCERFVEAAQKADTTSRAFSLNGEYISPLPATETEVQQINQIHADKGIMSRYFVREEANEALIKKGELAKYDYIHFATHGFVNSQFPELSGLLLAQRKDLTEDGVLYSGEILGLTLNAELVTLSACETALGKKIEGEGVRGLTTAFLFAGAKSVVASLWKVADESTSQLMISFYNELLSGKDKATALQQAKLKLITGDKFNHPYYWAPFVQIGGN